MQDGEILPTLNGRPAGRRSAACPALSCYAGPAPTSPFRTALARFAGPPGRIGLRVVVVVVRQDPPAVALRVIVLVAAQGPEKRQQPGPAENQRDRDQIDENIHFGTGLHDRGRRRSRACIGLRRSAATAPGRVPSLSALSDTVIEEADIASAAISGVAKPGDARSARRSRCRAWRCAKFSLDPPQRPSARWRAALGDRAACPRPAARCPRPPAPRRAPRRARSRHAPRPARRCRSARRRPSAPAGPASRQRARPARPSPPAAPRPPVVDAEPRGQVGAPPAVAIARDQQHRPALRLQRRRPPRRRRAAACR